MDDSLHPEMCANPVEMSTSIFKTHCRGPKGDTNRTKNTMRDYMGYKWKMCFNKGAKLCIASLSWRDGI